MTHFLQPRHSSPPSTQHHDNSPDTSLSTSDRSVRSMHSAPSLTSHTSSSAMSNPSTNNNVHLIPLPHSHLHIHSEDDSIEYSDDGGHKPIDMKSEEDVEEDTVQVFTLQVPAPNITITPTQERLAIGRVDSGRTAAPSFDSPDDNRSGEPDSDTIRTNEHEVYADDDEESDSGVTDELRRTLFYRPSTDPVAVIQSQSHRDPPRDSELDAILSAGATSSTNLLSNFNPNPDPNPPLRPPRPPSLNLSDEHGPQPAPKSVDIPRPGPGHSRMSSRERLGAIFGAKGNRNSLGATPRASLGAGRPSLGGVPRPSLGGYSGGVLPLSIKGKAPASFPVEERVVEVHQMETGDVGIERARTISDPPEDMDRSVWEDDTEELGTAWGLVKKWLGEESKASGSNSNTVPSKKTKTNRQGVKSLSLASTISAFRTPPTSPGIRESRRYSSPLLQTSTPAGLRHSLHDSSALGLRDTSSPDLHDSFGLSVHDNSGPALRESSVLGLHESSILGSSSGHDWTNRSASRASYQTANVSFQTETQTETGTEAPSTSFQTARASTSQSNPSFHSLNPSQSFQSLTASQPSFHSLDPTASQPSFQSLSTSRRGPQNRRLGVGARTSVASSLSSLAEPPESPTMRPVRVRSETVSSYDQERPRSQLLVVPERESKPLFTEPEPQKEQETKGLPSPPSSPGPTTRSPTTTARSLHNPTYPSLHKRLGSLVQHSTPKQAPPSPLSPLWSPPQAVTSSRWDQSARSSRWDQSGTSPPWDQSRAWSPMYPSTPGALGMESDVRPISGITESSYYGRGSGAGTAGRPESGGTWAGSQRGLLIPPQAKTVRLVDPPERERRARDKDASTMSPSLSRANSIFRTTPSVYSTSSETRIRRRVEYEAGMSPGKWFALGFVLGPWCWLIGGWMLDGRNRVTGVIGDAEKGVRIEGEQWVRRCRIAAVVSGVAVLAAALVAIAYAVRSTMN
ncbi:anaphase-promoting complex subunit 1 [Ceratobasidium sp. AG-Ba]|nr:anaphase-promoting complex subunit 1 [Ceratobasidium sp. AG-Ba]